MPTTSDSHGLQWCPTCEDYVSKDTAFACADPHCEMFDLFPDDEDTLEDDPIVPLNFHDGRAYGMMDYLNDTKEPEEDEDDTV